MGFGLGMTLVDTAEMYANGGAEDVVGEALKGYRDQVYVVTKVLPENASTKGTVAAAERSLKRLKTDWIDLYLLHWDGPHPLEETLSAFEKLVREGKIREYGISNFDVDVVQTLNKLRGGSGVAANQVFYNLKRRGIERRLIPECQKRGILVMAYSPFEQGKLPLKGAPAKIARRHGVTPAAVVLAWTIRLQDVVTIPKAGRTDHLEQNVEALSVHLTTEDLEELDREFPVPKRDGPLEML
jgi:diketogulonate reductase-like aldo/keto reductase